VHTRGGTKIRRKVSTGTNHRGALPAICPTLIPRRGTQASPAQVATRLLLPLPPRQPISSTCMYVAWCLPQADAALSSQAVSVILERDQMGLNGDRRWQVLIYILPPLRVPVSISRPCRLSPSPESRPRAFTWGSSPRTLHFPLSSSYSESQSQLRPFYEECISNQSTSFSFSSWLLFSSGNRKHLLGSS
jgi:hypothetical protein